MKSKSLAACKDCGGPKPTKNRLYCEACSGRRAVHYYGHLSPDALERKRQRDRIRSSPDKRGYGKEHRRLRAKWAAQVDRGEVRCGRCGKWIPPAGEGPCPAVHDGETCGKDHGSWDLGHADGDKSRYTGPEHVCCNRRTAAHKASRRAAGRRTSRSW